MEGRIDLLRRLMRKYGDSEEEMLSRLERFRVELDTIDMHQTELKN